MSKYIDAEKLTAEIERLKGQLIYGACAAQIEMETNCKDEAYNEVLSFITSLQQEQETKFIEINGIRYKEVPAKTDDKICKECDYFLDNGSCNLDDCPCTCDGNILERIHQEQPEVDYNKFEELFYDFCERNKGHHITSHDACMWFWKLGLNARKEK